MTPDSVGPFSRPVPLHRVTPGGVTVEVEANAEERAALAADLDLPAIHRLTGRYRLTGATDRVRVEGTLRAEVEQTCVVSLEPFGSRVEEDVAVEFAPPRPRGRREVEVALDADDDPPDELLGDQIDLGAVTAEFLALGLDPYPRKPGIAFEPPPDEAPLSPLLGDQVLKRLSGEG